MSGESSNRSLSSVGERTAPLLLAATVTLAATGTFGNRNQTSVGLTLSGADNCFG